MSDDELMDQLTKDRLLEAAVRSTGLSDFGDDDFELGLDVLLESLRATARDLNAYGRVCATGMPLTALENRLHLQENARRHPEVAQVAVERPVFILGLPRSGTTLLHNLLALHPDLRAPLMWELQAPATPRGQTQADLVRATNASLDVQHEKAPTFRSIHLQLAEGPEECTWLLMNELRSFLFVFCFDVPDYRTWLTSTPMHHAFGSHRAQLQQLLWRRPGETLVLKDPYHSLYLDAIDDVYGDARFVYLHRDPAEVLGSLCSLYESVRTLTYDTQDVTTYGAELADLVQQLLVRQHEFRRSRRQPGRALDVAYDTLASDPVFTACSIMESLDLEVTPHVRARLSDYVTSNRKDRYGVHRYSLGRYCADETAMAHRLRELADTYGGGQP